MISTPLSLSRDGAGAMEETKGEAARLEKGALAARIARFLPARQNGLRRGPAIGNLGFLGPPRGLAEGRQSPRLPAGLGGGIRET